MHALHRTTAVAMLAAMALFVTGPASPASAADAVPPAWVPSRAALPSSFVAGDALERLKMDMAQSVASKGRIDPHLYLQTAAAKGAYIPGLSDAATKAGVSPYAITEAQARASYAGYSTDMSRPGSGSAISTGAASRGVVSVQNPPGSGARGALNKGGAAMGRALGVATIGYAGWSLGTAVGGGVASLIGLPTSGSMICDLTIVVTDNTSCTVTSDEDYVVNQDVSLIVPGWKNGKNWIDVGHGVWTVKILPEPVLGRPLTEGWRIDLVYSGSLADPSLSSNARFEGYIDLGYVGWDTQLNKFVAVQRSNGATAQPRQGTERDLTSTWPVYNSSANPRYTFDHIELNHDKDTTAPMALVGDGKPMDAVWYPPGHKDRPIDVESDPVRWWRTDWTCTDGGTGTARSQMFRESDSAWAVPEQARCATGEVASMKITQVTAGLADVVVYEWATPQKTKDFLAAYPECGVGQCTLDLLTTVTGTQVSCFLSPELCTNWLTSATRDTDYQCTYAGKSVALSECFLYGPSFNRGLVEKGQVYGDPATGTALTPVAPPVGNPDPTPTPKPQPQDSNCPPAFSLSAVVNPWWYYKGMSCALTESFVPKTGFFEKEFGDLQLTMANHAPFSVIVAIPAIVGEFAHGWNAGCQGMPNFSGIQGLELRMACAPPDSAAWQAAYAMMAGIIWSSAAIAIWHMVSRAIGGK